MRKIKDMQKSKHSLEKLQNQVEFKNCDRGKDKTYNGGKVHAVKAVNDQNTERFDWK